MPNTKQPEIIILKDVQARDISEATKLIKKYYPYCKILTYKFDEDYRFISKKSYKDRTMKVALILNVRKINWDL